MARLPEPGFRDDRSPAALEDLPLRIGFVGYGRAAVSLARGFARRGHEVVFAARNERVEVVAAGLKAQVVPVSDILATADVTFLAVPDGLVAAVAATLATGSPAGDGRLVAHLAGSLSIDALAPLADRGFSTAALHPLQVLSGWRIAAGTTFAVETGPGAEVLAARLVDELGGISLAVPAAARTAYHAAAVMAANLGMTLLSEAADLLEAQGIPRAEALQGLGGLVRGGLEASMDRGLPSALTGPVARGDLSTVAGHLAALAADPDLQRAYAATSMLTLRQVQRDGRPTDAAAATALRTLLDAAR